MNAGISLFARASAEVVDLHRFFVEWYDAKSAAGADFGRFERAMGQGFHMIPPDGGILDRQAVVDFVRRNRAAYDGNFSIGIEDIHPGFETADMVVVYYVEVQQRAGRHSRRRASALFTASSSAPNGVEWRHLQETWLQMPEDQTGSM